ncbi:MAG TPA: hypothetical protein VGP02_19500 [Mycobacteriales bacterium]|jgi:hypothetical protein|nr:hypothetical protein [Mycobacteriales bacterium]
MTVTEQILAASRERRHLDCHGETVDAEEVREACLAAAVDGDPFGIRLANAEVTGELDLRAAHVGVPVHLTGCTFTDAPAVEGADLHELIITASPRLPGLLANGVRVRRNLVLSGCVIRGAHRTSASLTRPAAVWLTEADIGGRLLAVGTRIDGLGGRAMQCDRTKVAGDVRLVHGFLATGEVRLLAMQLAGSLDLRGASLLPHDGRALDLAETVVGGSVFVLSGPGPWMRPRIRGRVDMGRTTVHGRLVIRNADLEAAAIGSGIHDYTIEEPGTRRFLFAPRLTVHGECVIDGETVIRGGLFLHGAELVGGLRLDGGTIWNPGDIALDLSHVSLGAGLDLRDALIEGTVELENARVDGSVDLTGAQLTLPHRHTCLDAVGVRVEGDLLLCGATARGGRLDFRGASLLGAVDAKGATLSNPGNFTLNLNHAHVGGNVRLHDGFTSVGLVALNRSVIEGRLRCDGATLAWTAPPPDAPPLVNDRGSAFEAISAVVRSGIDLGWRIRDGAVDFTDARTGYLADDPAVDWPRRAYLSGFVYERFAPPSFREGGGVSDARTRGAWLARLEPYDPRPWEQVARVLRAGGDHSGAEDVLIAQRRRARQLEQRRWRRIVDRLLDGTVRYGYRPQRALAIMLVLVAAVAVSLAVPAARATMRATDPSGVVFTPDGPAERAGAAPPGACGGGRVRCFQPVLYALDTVVPIIDLKQRSTWYPSRDRGGTPMEWFLNACTMLGWAASTVFALSFTRLGRPSSP